MSMNSAERGLPLSTGRIVDTRSPFVRLAELIAGVAPGRPVIDLGVGEPRHPVPDFVGPAIAAHINEFGRYPRNEGTPQFRRAAADWAARRYRLGRIPDPDREVLVLNGSREGLFLGAIAARRHVANRAGRPAILVPNPFYAAYSAGAAAADCEIVYLPTTRQTGFLPDLDALDGALLARTVAMFLATPSNPQGAVADLAYLQRAAAMARRYGFLLFCDECYSEIYTVAPPAGALEAAGDLFENVVLFQSLSKRSNLPGLRVGFVMGDHRFIAKFLELRNVAAPQVPIPVQEVAIAAFGDEAHVEANRDLYRQKFDMADQIIGDRYGYRRPAGGFFLWLDVGPLGGSEAAAAKLWRDAGVRVLPGRYIARDQADGSNPGADFIRVAMVHDRETTAEALHRIVAVLG
ncbi:MAG TPA: aminotransferase class I/II-fold pyridoxal phosphate-dependent enzyme [Xanthobacteraceae bacterium]|nr:aminotransferase class I/II-fold pyridoxal phosphate-dependent enzyme [Xanthobacteraceae bacterium]